MHRGERVPDGCYRTVAHLCIINSENKMLIQRRNKTKSSYAGLWDFSVGGHIISGETSAEGIRRELLEELVKENEVFFCIPNDEFVVPIKAIGCHFIDNSLLDRHGTNPIQELKLISFYKKVLYFFSTPRKPLVIKGFVINIYLIHT